MTTIIIIISIIIISKLNLFEWGKMLLFRDSLHSDSSFRLFFRFYKATSCSFESPSSSSRWHIWPYLNGKEEGKSKEGGPIGGKQAHPGLKKNPALTAISLHSTLFELTNQPTPSNCHDEIFQWKSYDMPRFGPKDWERKKKKMHTYSPSRCWGTHKLFITALATLRVEWRWRRGNKTTF